MCLRKLKILILFGLLLSLVLALNISYAGTLDTQLSRDKIALGETFTLSYTLNSNTSITSPDFSALEKDFRILGKNYENAISMINGTTTIQTIWQLTLEPKKAGIIILPEINFGNLKSASRQLIVEEIADQAANAEPDSSAFLQAKINNTTPYVQSQIIYTLKLFFQSPLENPRIEIPKIKDATFVELGNGNHYRTTIKDKSYFVIEKNFAFFPQKTGKISIPPFHFYALTDNINSGLMNDPFYISVPKPISLSTQSFTLTVCQIPDTFQGKTWLPAKNISLIEKWSISPEHWELGNPVTRTIIVEANGLRADQVPDLAISKVSGANIYVDPPKRSNIVKDNSVIGVLEQKVTYIPNSLQSLAIPPLTINWWNLQTNTNAIAQLNPITVPIKGKINQTESAPEHVSNATAIDTIKRWFSSKKTFR